MSKGRRRAAGEQTAPGTRKAASGARAPLSRRLGLIYARLRVSGARYAARRSALPALAARDGAAGATGSSAAHRGRDADERAAGYPAVQGEGPLDT